MRVIYKYPLADETTIMLPANAEVRNVHCQQGIPCIWVELDPTALTEFRTFRVRGTGQDTPKEWIYVGTCHDEPMGFVWHIYEKPPSELKGK